MGAEYIIIFVLFIAVFYFFVIRPESKKRKTMEKMRSELAVGDQVTTIGGLVGTVCNIRGELVTVETGADRVRVEFTKWAISNRGVAKSDPNENSGNKPSAQA